MKNQLLKSSILILLTLVFTWSCNKDDALENIPKVDLGAQPADFSTSLIAYKGHNITINSLLVKVVDQDNEPVSNAEVKTGNSVLNTDLKGLVLFNNAPAFKNFLTAKISKINYITTAKTIAPTSNGPQILEVVLLKADETEQINSGSPQSVSTASGVKIDFTGDFIHTHNDTPYNGLVNVSIKYLSPDNETTYEVMPGSLISQNTGGAVKLLETYGMVAVNLAGASGEALNINSAHKATITFPVASSQLGIAPENIPLWSFDEDQGIWHEEGSAIKEGANYVGEVSHFTWWNVDVPINLVNFCLTVTNKPENHILPNQKITITRKSTGQTIFTGKTDKEGRLCGAIPKNEEIIIKLFNKKNNCLQDGILLNGTFGKYNNEDNIIDIVIDENNTNIVDYTIIGNITSCGGITGSVGVIELVHQETTQFLFTETDGSFHYTIQGCKDDLISLTAYDVENKKSTEPQILNFTNNNVTVSNLETCKSYNERIYVGNVELYNQEEVDIFGALGYTKIEGDLNIGKLHSDSSNIISLAPLTSLTFITGNLVIESNFNLNSLKGLESITSVGGNIWILFNDSLTSLIGLDNITSIGISLTIQSNDALTSLKGLDNLTSTGGDLAISNNNSLISLTELKKITSVAGSLNISDTSLTSLTGLENITSLESLNISSNPALTSLKALNNFTSITGYLSINDNDSLTSLEGLNNLISTGGDLYISDNNSLISLTELEKITSVGGTLFIYDTFLTSLKGLESITSLGGVYISNNPVLTSLESLENITSISDLLLIEWNPALTSLTGLENITSLGGLNISANDALTSLTGLENITSLESLNIYDTSLTNLTGLDNITSLEAVYIYRNNILTNLCALSNTTIGGTYKIFNNAYNPTQVQLANPSTCSQ